MEEKGTLQEKHTKHAKLPKPMLGEYHRQEWAVLGTPCGEIRALVGDMAAKVGAQWKLGYLEADHQAAERTSQAGISLMLTDKISHFNYDYPAAPAVFAQRALLNHLDALFVNGNHFVASRQIVVVDPRKDLVKKIDRLTNVCLVLLADGQTAVPEAVQQKIAPGTPVFSLKDRQRIISWLASQLVLSVAPVKGLVLAGGQSQRMSTDKGLIMYHGKPQREYLYELLAAAGVQPHISIRHDQRYAVPENFNTVVDSFIGLGPYGAILSALMADPNSAWLVVACDLPLLTSDHLRLLSEKRDATKMATAFYNPDTGFPEPLITLWEPKAYPVLLQFLAQGYSCPRKALINSDIALVRLEDTAFMMNANTPEDKQAAEKLIAGRT